MRAEFAEISIGELIRRGRANLQTGPFGTMLSASEYELAGTPVIAVKDIGDNRINDDNLVFVDSDVVQRLNRYQLDEGDIVFGRKGAVERRAIVRRREVGWLQGSDCIRLRLDRGTIDPVFVSYQLGSRYHREWLQQFASGATMPSLNQEILELLPLFLPTLSQQRAIASVLSSLDDKINLLHRQNKTLEGFAETLFREWFVEKIEDHWKRGKLGDAITVKGGTTPSTKRPEFWNGNIHWTSPRDLSNHDSVFLVDTEKKITEIGLAEIGSGLFPAGSVLFSSRAPIGYLAISDIPVAINQGYIGIICDRVWPNYFTYLWIKDNLDAIVGAAHGSVFPEIPKSTFKDLDVVSPPTQKLVDFDKLIRPFFDKIRSNVHQIRSLRQLRDLLIPKLISGELKVQPEGD